MMRRFISSFVVVGVVTVSVSDCAAAAKSPIDAFPDSAGVVVRFKNPQKTIRKLIAFVSKLNEDAGKELESASLRIGEMISNPDGAGVDKKGDWWLAVFPRSDRPPGIVFAIPASDVEAMKKAVGQGVRGRRRNFGFPGALEGAGADASDREGADVVVSLGELAGGGLFTVAALQNPLEGLEGAGGGGRRRGRRGSGTFQFVENGKWLMYSDDLAAVQAVRSRLRGRGKSISSRIDAQSREIMNQGDLSVFVNVREIRKHYQMELEEASAEIEEMLEEMQDFAPAVPGLDLKPVFEMYGRLYRGILQSIHDAEGFTAAVSLKSGGFVLEEYLRFTSNSPTDKFLRANATSDLKTLGKLPPNQLMYFGAHGDAGGLMQWSMKLSVAMFQGNDDLKTAMQNALTEFAKMKFGDLATSFGLGDIDTGILRSTTVIEVEPVEKMREVTRKSSQAMTQLSFVGVEQSVDLQVDAEKYGDRSADLLTIQIEVDEEADPFGFQKKIMETMYGPEGAVQRIVYLDDKVVQTSGGGKPAMEQALKFLTADSSADTAQKKSTPFLATRSKLLEKANLVALVDLTGLVVDALNLALDSGQIPIPIDTAAITKLGLKRSYLGFSLATEPSGLRMQTFIPQQQISGIYKLVTLFQSFSLGPQF